MVVTLLPLVLALLHATGAMPVELLKRLDHIFYDTRLQATMPRTLDERVVIVDIDERSLAEIGHWPWGRHQLARLTNELFDRQRAAVLGFDVVFPEEDDSSGLQRLRQLAQGELRDQTGFKQRLQQLESELDYDGAFARSLNGRPVVLGYYFTNDSDGRSSGKLPPPALAADRFEGRPIRFMSWTGYGANIQRLVAAAPMGGYFNPMVDTDGLVRSVPLLTEYQGRYYESLALAMFRMLIGLPAIEPVFVANASDYHSLEAVRLRQGDRHMDVRVADGVTVLVPYRGPGGPDGGSFRYVSAADVIHAKLPAGSLEGKVVLVGTTAPGLKDLRATPVGEAYAGVEAHANVISGLLDGRTLVRPDYAAGYDILVLTAAGLLLALLLPTLSAARAVILSLAVIAAGIALNFWLYLSMGLVLPLAAFVSMALIAFALNMSYGYFVESRSKRELAQLFGTYVPPELVDEMVKDPDSYSMTAANKALTVMFCDMRGFTRLSEQMEPTRLQGLLNNLFTRLTNIIRTHRGTIDKYMGDCVMAFWGAPVDTPEHPSLAVATALEMAAVIDQINIEHKAAGLPSIGIGIGLNTGTMCVGDMGSDIRRAYTVIGDEVNLASRLEGLSKVYGGVIVASESTRNAASGFVWQELDKVRVKGKARPVAIFQPVAIAGQCDAELSAELDTWAEFLRFWRSQDWDPCDRLLQTLTSRHGHKPLYALYASRLDLQRQLPVDPDWDGATNYETK